MTLDAGALVPRLDGIAAGRLAQLAPPSRHPNGFTQYEGRITRSGIFRYRQPDGSVRVEYRPANEVAKALPTLRMVPVTDGHPPEEVVTAENATRHQRGSTGEAFRMDASWVVGPLTVHDAGLAKRTDAGESGVSGGLLCQTCDEPGVFEGVTYTHTQRNLKFNHVALLDSKRGKVPRAGDDCRVRVDCIEFIDAEPSVPRVDGDIIMVKRTIGGKEVEVTEEVAARLDAADAEIATEKAKAKAAEDALTARTRELTTARTDGATAVADAEEKARKAFDAKVNEAVEVKSKARTILGAEAKLDGVSPLEIKKLVLAKRTPDVKLDGQSDAYINAAFDLATRNDAAAEMAPAIRGGAAPAGGRDRARTETRLDAEDIEDAGGLLTFVAQQRHAQFGQWRRPIDNTQHAAE